MLKYQVQLIKNWDWYIDGHINKMEDLLLRSNSGSVLSKHYLEVGVI